MKQRKIEFYVGLFVILGMACVGYLVVVLGGASFLTTDRLSLHGYFSSVSGLRPGARVEMAGVQIGTVANIAIDKEMMVAKVVFHIDKSLGVSEDSIASVKTSGIIGEKYIDISPGGADLLLEDGDEITNTESSLDIESLVRKFIFSETSP